MTFKEWSAVIQLVAAAIVAAWLVMDATGKPWPGEISDVAGTLIWAIGFTIVFSIVTNIVVAIAVSIARGEELKDERADERDRSVSARAMRNAYLVLSIGGATSLLLLAVGLNPAIGAYVLFASLLLAGATESASRLVYYRFG